MKKILLFSLIKMSFLFASTNNSQKIDAIELHLMHLQEKVARVA